MPIKPSRVEKPCVYSLARQVHGMGIQQGQNIVDDMVQLLWMLFQVFIDIILQNIGVVLRLQAERVDQRPHSVKPVSLSPSCVTAPAGTTISAPPGPKRPQPLRIFSFASPFPCPARACASGHIVSGASTPIRPSVFAIACRAARHSARRAAHSFSSSHLMRHAL